MIEVKLLKHGWNLRLVKDHPSFKKALRNLDFEWLGELSTYLSIPRINGRGERRQANILLGWAIDYCQGS